MLDQIFFKYWLIFCREQLVGTLEKVGYSYQVRMDNCEVGGEGNFDVIFQSKKVYPTKFMSFFFGNFCRLLGSGRTSPPVPPWHCHFLNSIL